MSDTPGQQGKEITIYADANPEKSLDDWQKILKLITERLANGNVPPGFKSTGTIDKPEGLVNGSSYITYRYFDESGRYKKADISTLNLIKKIAGGVKDNGWPVEDILQRVKLVVENQNEPSELKEQKSEGDVEYTAGLNK